MIGSMRRALLPILAVVLVSAVLSGQEFVPAPGADPLHRPLDQILDVNVRDGLVYYGALKSDRGRLDRYIASLNVPAATYDKWSKGQQMAFWVNAYNAFVLQTVASRYPLSGTIKQIPGAFDRNSFRAANRTVTLEELRGERLILMQEGAGVRQIVEDALRRQGVRLRDLDVRLELGLQESVRRAVEAGYGVTFISRTAVEAELAAGTLETARVAGVEPARQLYVVRPRGRTATRAAEAFLAFAREQAK